MVDIPYNDIQVPSPRAIGVIRGDDRSWQRTVRDQNGSVVDITGSTITFTVKTQVGGTQVLTKSVGSGITITDGTNGVYTVSVTPSDTSSSDPGLYWYDIQLAVSGKTITVARGPFWIVGDIA